MSCYDAQIIRRMTAFRLDACGRIPLVGTDPTPALKGLEGAIQNFTRTRNVDQPTDNTTKVVNGGTCSKPRGTPTDRGWQYTLNFCGQNPIFEYLTGYKTLDIVADEIVGWEDVELTGSQPVALEIIFEPSLDACTIGEDPQCIALIVPYLEAWVRSGDEAYDGETVPDLSMSANTRLSANLFGNYANALALPDYLAHWEPKFDDIATGRSWSYTYLIDCPAETAENVCELVAVDSAS